MKKNLSEKKKSQYYRIQDYVMHTKNYILHEKKISENVPLRTKFDLGLKKKNTNNYGANFHLKKLLCRHQKMPIVEIP